MTLREVPSSWPNSWEGACPHAPATQLDADPLQNWQFSVQLAWPACWESWEKPTSSRERLGERVLYVTKKSGWFTARHTSISRWVWNTILSSHKIAMSVNPTESPVMDLIPVETESEESKMEASKLHSWYIIYACTGEINDISAATFFVSLCPALSWKPVPDFAMLIGFEITTYLNRGSKCSHVATPLNRGKLEMKNGSFRSINIKLKRISSFKHNSN